MLTLASSNFVSRYIQQASPAIREDLLEIIQMMELIAPEAELVGGLGIPYFQQNAGWLYGVAAREDHLCVYFSDLSVLYPFAERLPHVQFGDNCFIIHRLDEINLNVLAELFGQIKVHFLLNHREPSVLIQ
ncbi:hypothetical protein CYL31_16330 [Marinomonas sp. A3A]|jgi:uncharacterized protein YdhG (YjbR/CyaY superfamily)|uniref:DUF1801 domain-containing protein n=1 Tax=Marinomonas TaxID=28253 RepID=UPI001BB314EA|nr:MULTISPECIES: DUF1801 domain-containing protein [Marinomonas]QUX92875.1 hypothetical protein CYL31_16330 [Marinomonas sp. A3A]